MDGTGDPKWAPLIAAARRRWPALGCADLVLRTALARCPDATSLERWGLDLALAAACAAGDPGAVAYFERDFVDSVPSYVARMRLDSATIDELKQQMRVRALSGTPPRIASYNGAGSLEGWVRVMTVRLALTFVAEERRHAGVDRELDQLPAMSAPAARSLALLSSDRARFESALEEALSSLQPRQRTLLRMNVFDGVSIDGIADLHGVHRATAARWLVAIRRKVYDHVRAKLSPRERLSSTDLASLIEHVRGDVEVSLQRVLATNAGGSERNDG